MNPGVDNTFHFTLPLDLTIRLCRGDHLTELEWFGTMSAHREIIRDTFRSQERGDALMLVAEVNGFPAGQVWINLVLKQEEKTGCLWAVRVLPPLQNMGIGSRLVRAAEKLLSDRGYRTVELGVEKDNPRARKFYERLGYRVFGTAAGEYGYTTQEGESVRVPIDEWIMSKPLSAPNEGEG